MVKITNDAVIFLNIFIEENIRLKLRKRVRVRKVAHWV